ncbi:MAG: hypothetical protein IPL84_06285 [Chitinophagaceae bacterium]|nr:hypothetical protein [Chitinophagaceae bacterium]
MKLLLTFVLFFCSTGCFSQAGDYLIKNNGDTIWGDIKLKGSVFYVKGANPASCKAEDVNKIKSRSYKGNTVVTCTLQLYTDNIEYLEMDYLAKEAVDTVMILSEIYSTPKINLYYGVDDFRAPFYFYKTPTDAKPIQLVVRFSLEGGINGLYNDPTKNISGASRIALVEDRGYVNQLHTLMGDCEKIPDFMWELLSYRIYSLKQLIKNYNSCN